MRTLLSRAGAEGTGPRALPKRYLRGENKPQERSGHRLLCLQCSEVTLLPRPHNDTEPDVSIHSGLPPIPLGEVGVLEGRKVGTALDLTKQVLQQGEAASLPPHSEGRRKKGGGWARAGVWERLKHLVIY